MWFKRDLRFTDHEPLFMAQQEDNPTILLYFFEPSVMNYDDSDVRHWRFVYESLQDMQSKLISVGAKIYFFHNEVKPVFEEIVKFYDVKFKKGCLSNCKPIRQYRILFHHHNFIFNSV